ncbi:MAG: hypothetical protein K0U93_05365 [Gammaproteobacteria bacterium]|nr:hypothetical protein [Gammaproteobacteria bacterium]
MSRPERLTLREAYRFFLPLMLMAELMMISHSIIAAFLARMDNPEPILAAYSISFYAHATLGSPIWATQIVAVSFIRDRASLLRLFNFNLYLAGALLVLWVAIGLTPVGDWFFGTLFGASPEVVEVAKRCFMITYLIVVFVIFRSLAYALFMINRKTLLVTLGTFVRLGGLAIVIWLLSGRFEGAIIGAIALVACIGIESVYGLIVAIPFIRKLESRRERTPSYRELWTFSWPIMLMQAAESGVAFTVNFFLGRLLRAELALAAFGVLDSLMRVLLSPLRNITQTAQTLTHSRHDMRVLLIFGAQVAVMFALVMLLFFVPGVRRFALETVMGLPREMADYAGQALGLAALLAECMAAAGLFRGLLIASRRTRVLAVSAGARVVAVALVGAVSILLGGQNGALVGMCALVAAFAAEAAVLGWRLRKIMREVKDPFFIA